MEQLLLDLVTGPAEVLSYILKNRRESADPKRIVPWNREVVLTGLLRCQTHMAAGLSGDPVSQRGEGPGEIIP